MKEFNNIFHRHEPVKDIDHMFVECSKCDFSYELEKSERWCGFSSENEVLAEEVEKDDYYCRECGVQALVKEVGSGDYYVGPVYYCDSCNSSFTMG